MILLKITSAYSEHKSKNCIKLHNYFWQYWHAPRKTQLTLNVECSSGYTRFKTSAEFLLKILLHQCKYVPGCLHFTIGWLNLSHNIQNM